MIKTRKLIGISFLIAAAVITQIPVTGASAAESDFQMNGTTLVSYTGTESSVSVPSTVKEIGDGAFADNKDITKVTIETGTKKIGYSAFSDNTALSKVTIGSSAEEIGTAAFANCYSVTDISVGSSVKTLGTGVFTGCEKLKTVSFDTGNKAFVCADGAIYNSDKTVLYEVLPGREGSSFTVPDTVKAIDSYAFYGCSHLTDVVLDVFAEVHEHVVRHLHSQGFGLALEDGHAKLQIRRLDIDDNAVFKP